jgi:hypothetical protein
LIDHGFEDGARFIVWPSTNFDHHSLRIASQYHYLGFAGVDSPSGQLLTSPMKITRIPVHDTPLPELSRLISLADEYNQLLVLQIRGVGQEDAMLSESTFRAVIEHLAESGLTVDTASSLWERMPH